MNQTDPVRAAIDELRASGVLNEDGIGDTELRDIVARTLEVAAEAEALARQCDEPGCTREASCGYPTAAGYRRTCGQHADWKQAIPAAAAAVRAEG